MKRLANGTVRYRRSRITVPVLDLALIPPARWSLEKLQFY